MSKWREETIQLKTIEKNFVPLVSSSIVAINGFAEGKSLPVLFLDLTNRQDVIELIDNHQYIDEKNGQVIGKWIVQSRKIASTVKLLLDFKKPTSCKLIIKFDVQKQGPTVDMIIRNGGC